MTFVYIYLSIIIIHALIRAYLFPRYLDLKAVERVRRGYLKFSENYKYQQSYWKLQDGPDLKTEQRFYYRIDIQLKGLYRALFGKLIFEKEVRKLVDNISDVNSIDPEKFFKYKKRGKISL